MSGLIIITLPGSVLTGQAGESLTTGKPQPINPVCAGCMKYRFFLNSFTRSAADQFLTIFTPLIIV
jgi:hypothetical protein